MRKALLGSLVALIFAAGSTSAQPLTPVAPNSSASLRSAVSLGGPTPAEPPRSSSIQDPQLLRTAGTDVTGPLGAPAGSPAWSLQAVPPVPPPPPPPPPTVPNAGVHRAAFEPLPSIGGPPSASPAPGWFSGGGEKNDTCFWVDGEYLLWWVKDGPLPVPLVTTGAPTPTAVAGAMNNPTTRVLFGGRGLDYGMFSGLRISAGAWIDSCHKFGVEGSGFVLEHRSKGLNAVSTAAGGPFLAVPFVAVVPPMGETALSVSIPGIPTGVTASSGTQLWGGEVNGLFNLFRTDCFHVDLLGGFRYLELDEDLDLNAVAFLGGVPSIAAVTAPLGVPGIASLSDRFKTTNEFYGGQLGAKAGYRYWRLTADVIGKIALGATHEVVHIEGAKAISAGAFLITAPGGFFAEPSNIGRQSRNTFAVVPEVQVQFGIDVCRCVRAFVGYDFLYVSHVVRPGDQIDRSINLTQLNGVPPLVLARPVPLFKDADFWAQGIGFGVEFRY